MKKETILGVSLLVMLLATMIGTAYATTTVYVKILDPSTGGTYGISSNGYWVGEIPIKITSGGSSTNTVAYCINYDKTVNIGATYTATLDSAADTAAWRATSYILSWYYPTNNTQGAVDQVAMWKLLNPGYTRQSWLDVNIYNAGISLATLASGKDVVRTTDILRWVSPITTNMSAVQANPGETITFTAQLTSSTGTPRANVRIIFNAILNPSGSATPLNSTYVTPLEAFTDSNGMAQVSVTVPSDALLGSTIEVKACTQSMWPQKYINIEGTSNQDLLGIDTGFQLTVSTNVCLIAYIMVLPESALGALSAFVAFAAAFAIWNKFKHPRALKGA